MAYLDVYYGDDLLAPLLARYDESTVSIENPSALLELLPATKAPDGLARFFSKPVVHQPAERCNANSIDACFSQGQKVAVTLDPDVFVMRVYIAPSLLKVFEVDNEKYLPPYSSKPSYLADIDAIYSASDDDLLGYSESYNFSVDQVLSVGHKRLRAQLGQTSANGFYARELMYISERQRNRIQLGRYEISGDRLTPSRLVQALGIHTTTDLRLDLDQNGGSRLEIFLPQRSRVEIYRDGRLLSAEYYPVGNQQLDVSGLPNGAYDIEVRVIANGVVTSTETRFFTKSTRLPPVGENHLGFDYGQVASPRKLGTEDDGGFVRLVYAHRIDEPGYLEISSMNTQHWSSLQSTYSWLRQDFLGDVALQVAGDGYRAAALALSRQLDYGVLGLEWAKAKAPPGLTEAETYFRRFAADAESSAVRYSYVHRRWAAQFQFRIENNGDGEQQVVAATGTWTPGAARDRLKLSASLQHSEREGFQGTVDLLWRIPDGNRHYWARSRWSNRDNRRVTSALGVSGSRVGDDSVLRYDLAGEERESGNELLSEAQYENSYFRSSSALNVQQNGNHNRALSTNFHTSLAASEKGGRLFGGAGRQAGILVSLPDQERTPVTIVINDTRRVAATSGGTHFIPLQAYGRYHVRVQPKSGSSLEYDASGREVILYPGHIPVLEWHGTQVIPVFGQVRVESLPEGAMLTVATSRGRDVVENGGYFVGEVTTDSPSLTFSQQDQQLCTTEAAVSGSGDEVVDMGVVRCEVP